VGGKEKQLPRVKNTNSQQSGEQKVGRGEEGIPLRGKAHKPIPIRVHCVEDPLHRFARQNKVRGPHRQFLCHCLDSKLWAEHLPSKMDTEDGVLFYGIQICDWQSTAIINYQTPLIIHTLGKQ
jgi:hypothetical protein